MIDGIKPYPKMKASGLLWCPLVPEHWDLVPNRAFLRQRKVLVGNRHPDYTLLSLTKNGVIIRDLSENKGKFSSDMGTSQEVRQGDLVMCLFDVPETPRTVGLSRYDGMITSAYTVFAVTDDDTARWIERFYISLDDRKALSPLYSGLRNTIPKPRLLGAKTPVPPKPEMIAISRFLNAADQRLRNYIRAKRKQIELLGEQQQADVDRMLTFGGLPKAAQRDSGFSWIGHIPAHWQVKRIKYLVRSVDCRSESGCEPLLTMRKHFGLVPYHEHFSKPPQAASLVGFKRIEPGQIAVNRMQAGFGLIFASRLHGLVSPDFGVFKPTGEVLPGFLQEVFRSRLVRAKFHSESKGLGTGKSGFMRLYDDRLGAIHIAYPPTQAEQQTILDAVLKQRQILGTAIEAAQRAIRLARLLMCCLSAEVTAGKLDVRVAAARLRADATDAVEYTDADEDVPDGDYDGETDDATQEHADDG
jgi:type I restriction enzyme S subunit